MRLTLSRGKKRLYSDLGEMLFTHFGVSGPLVLSASAYLTGLPANEMKLTLDLKPGMTEAQLDARILRDIAADVALLPPERRLRVHCELGDRPVIVRGNARLLESVFRNLTDNATAYSGGRDILIRLVEETPDAYAFLFADNGIGVPEEHLPHLFERFYRIDKGRSRKMGGTGLGLSIVRNAVALHGGRIEVRNGPDGGLEFRFTLRKRPDDSASAV